MTIGGMEKMEEQLIAPCGMNCVVCVSYLAMRNELNQTACGHPTPKGWGMLRAARSHARFYGIQK